MTFATVVGMAPDPGHAARRPGLALRRGLDHHPALQNRVCSRRRSSWAHRVLRRRHLARLRLISRLQDDGFSLRASVVGSRAWSRVVKWPMSSVAQEQSMRLSPAARAGSHPEEMAARLPADALSPALLQAPPRSASSPRPTMVASAPRPTLLDIGSALAALGIPSDVISTSGKHSWRRPTASPIGSSGSSSSTGCRRTGGTSRTPTGARAREHLARLHQLAGKCLQPRSTRPSPRSAATHR